MLPYPTINNQPPSAMPAEARTRRRPGQLLLRKVWLPRTLYALLPALYILLGCWAIVTGLFLAHWTWVIPYLLLAGCMCLQAAATVIAARWRNRQARRHPRS